MLKKDFAWSSPVDCPHERPGTKPEKAGNQGACHLLRHEQAGNHRHTGELYIRQFQVPLYLPERLDTEIFRTKLQKMKISMITVDESHCISQWGYDFRPAYLKIAEIRELLPGVPHPGIDSHRHPEVVKDIQARLHFREENVFLHEFRNAKPRLYRPQNGKQDGELLHILRRMPGSAIIYVRNRRRTKEITELLHNEDITADFYHAGLDDATKDIRQQRWQTGESRVMVATNAFGMGIDKPDVRIVIHMDLPDSIEAYFQGSRTCRKGRTKSLRGHPLRQVG